ncbi:MAG TPA: alpha/beta fold hydrolase [Acidimicrobiales bacterium]|nr:alpha/beta fold hydrolase [Acidimicrobiales bacterium]
MRDEPVLLVHGFATSAGRTWGDNGWVDLLHDAGREVIAPDLLGHGDAPKPHEPAAYAALEDDVAAHLPDRPVDAVGFSLGARVLLTLAARAPERFGRVVVAGVGANLFRTDDESSLVAAAVEGTAPSDDPVVQYFAGLARQPGTDPQALAACIRSPRPPLDAAVLARVSSPVLVVLGDRDFAGPADPLVEALPDARFQPLRGVDHFATPKDLRFIDAALGFLDALP